LTQPVSDAFDVLPDRFLYTCRVLGFHGLQDLQMLIERMNGVLFQLAGVDQNPLDIPAQPFYIADQQGIAAIANEQVVKLEVDIVNRFGCPAITSGRISSMNCRILARSTGGIDRACAAASDSNSRRAP
jgi:hypothetical protein